VAADDEFESFRRTLADLDVDGEQRIRSRFERARTPLVPEPSADDGPALVVELAPRPDTTEVVATAPRHSKTVLMGVAAALVLVGVITAVTLFRTSGTTTDVSSGIDDVPLSEIASRARAQPDVDLPPDQYFYRQRTLGRAYPQLDGSAPGFTLSREEDWSRRDGTGLIRDVAEFVPAGPGSIPGVGAPGVRDIPVRQTQPFMAFRDYDEIRSLPTDPDELVARAKQIVASDDPLYTADFLASLLALDVTPPDVRAAGFEALSSLGARSIGQVVTYDGPTGIGYQGTDASGRPWIVIVDPTTTKILGFVAGAGDGDRRYLDSSWFYQFGDERIESELPS
jgi:hypothetical protein